MRPLSFSTGLGDEQHPRTEGREAGQSRTGGAHRSSPVTDHLGCRQGKRCAGGSHHVGREHAGDYLRGAHVNETGQSGTEHRRQGNRALRVVDEAGGNGGGFNADEGPEAQQYGAGSGRYVGSTGHVPVGDVGIDVKPEPTEDGRPDDGDRHRNKTERREFADEGTAQKV